MRKFAPAELNTFFQALDAELSASTTIRLIGGAALSFYAPMHSTNDIDYVESAAPCEEAYASLGAKKSIAMLPLQRVTVHQPPDGFEKRWEEAPFDPPLKWVKVLIPERHDLALMKISRGYAHDFEGVYELHAVQPLDPETLVERYFETWVTGSRTDFRISFLLAFETMFGKSAADVLEARIGVR